MGDFRIRYGFGLGPYGAASAVSGMMQFANDDTTPDVTTGTLFLTNNTGATTITYFDVQTPGGLVSLDHNGKIVVLFVNDTSTTVANAGRIFLSQSGGVLNTGNTISFIYYNSSWYEFSRSQNSQTIQNAVTLLGTGAVNVQNIQSVVLTGSGGTTSVLVGLSGGVPGQRVYLMKDASLAITDTAMKLLSVADLQLAGTNALLMNASAAYEFICDVGSRFRQVGPAAMP